MSNLLKYLGCSSLALLSCVIILFIFIVALNVLWKYAYQIENSPVRPLESGSLILTASRCPDGWRTLDKRLEAWIDMNDDYVFVQVCQKL